MRLFVYLFVRKNTKKADISTCYKTTDPIELKFTHNICVVRGLVLFFFFKCVCLALYFFRKTPKKSRYFNLLQNYRPD